MKRKIIFCLIITSMMFCLFISFPKYALAAMDANIRMSGSKSVYDIGEEIQISYLITPSRPCLMEATVSVTGGLSFLNATVSLGQVSGARMVNDTEGGPYAGTIRVRANAAGNHTISLTNVRLGYAENPNDKLVTQQSITIRVRTAAEKQAAEAEAERIRQEQARKAEEERKRQEAINASIAEERAKEESIRKSKEEEEYRQAVIASSIAESIRASESEVERTRPSEIGDKVYARLDVPGFSDRVFYFALEDDEVPLPQGFESSYLTVNSLEVFAARTERMDRQTYLVYGLFEGEDDPDYYYYSKKTNQFFPYMLIEGTVGETESEESSSEETSSEETTEADSTDIPETRPGKLLRDLEPWKLISITVFSVLLGAALTVLSILIFGKVKKSGMKNEDKPVKRRKSAFDYEEMEDDLPGRNGHSDEAE